MTNFPEISRRARDIYHNLKDDDIMKNIFNSGRHKDRVGMKILDWMISDEMKHTEHYRMYAKVFGIDVPLTQRSTRLTPPALVPTIDKAYEMILQDTLQVSLAEHKSQEKQEAREDVELVSKHLSSEEIEKMVDKPENVIDDSPIPRMMNKIFLGTRYEIKAKEKGRVVRSPRYTTPTPIRCLRIHTDLVSSDTEKLQELKKTDTTPSLSSLNTKYLFEHLKAKFLSKKSFDTLADHLQEVMVESLTHMVDNIQEQVEKQVPEQVKVQVQVYVAKGLFLERQQNKDETDKIIAKAMLQEPIPQTTYVPEKQYQLYLLMKNNPQLQQQDIAIWLALQMKFKTLQVPQTTCRTYAVRPRDQDDPHDDAPPEGENSAKRQITSEYEAYVTRESSGQVNKSEQSPSSSGNQEQVDDYDFWTESYASDDDEIPTKQVSQDIMEEVSLTINEAELKKITDEMLRQRCTLGDEHQFQSCQRDPEAPALSLINQDLLYLKKGNSGPEKIVLSLHKFPAIIFNDVDIEERTSRWVNKQKEPGKLKEVIDARIANECIVSITKSNYKNLNKNDIKDIYLLIMNGKVPDYAETSLLWSLSVFIRSLVIWERVHGFQLGIERYQQKVNLTAQIISFPRIEKHKMFSIIYEPVHGIIYKNSKKEKRVMRHSEIHKFCDATLNRVLEGLKSYNNDVKYDYIQRGLTEYEVEYLKLFEEEIEVSQPDKKMVDVCKWKTTWTTKGTPRIIDP
ncbi:hypothetical protein Tco_0126580 [Tanacetum coccineum]